MERLRAARGSIARWVTECSRNYSRICRTERATCTPGPRKGSLGGQRRRDGKSHRTSLIIMSDDLSRRCFLRKKSIGMDSCCSHGRTLGFLANFFRVISSRPKSARGEGVIRRARVRYLAEFLMTLGISVLFRRAANRREESPAQKPRAGFTNGNDVKFIDRRGSA